MAIYLKKFETQAAYEAAQSGLILPNVSLTVDNNTVHYNPSTPPAPSHDYVEIGGIKWATMNIGANSVTDNGLYFEWGGTSGYTAAQVGYDEEQKYFGENDNIFYDPETSNYTKYNGEDELTTLQSSDDAVTAAWGGNWRMPTTAEYESLLNSVTTAWTADYQGSGVAGATLTDNNDSSKVLFFPACGYADEGMIYSTNTYGEYWTSSLNGEGDRYSDCFSFVNDNAGVGGTSRYGGKIVRGILDE